MRAASDIRKRLVQKSFIVIVLSCIFVVCSIGIYMPRYLQKTNEIGAEAIMCNSAEKTIMSFNIRYWSLFDFGEKNWFYRASAVIDAIFSASPSIIGFQEVTPLQYDYLKKKLAHYDSVIDYRDDSLFREGCPVFYNRLQYTLKESGVFWLSETPSKMSKSWGASSNRICSYVILIDNDSQKTLAVFNTHLDNFSEEARNEGMDIILNAVSKYDNIPIILMGDLNATESSQVYSKMTAKLMDAKYEAQDSMGGNTYHNWGTITNDEPIDYLMVSNFDFHVKKYYIVDQKFDGVYPSDHFPICIVVSPQNE